MSLQRAILEAEELNLEMIREALGMLESQDEILPDFFILPSRVYDEAKRQGYDMSQYRKAERL